jgi:hypothetical protein
MTVWLTFEARLFHVTKGLIHSAFGLTMFDFKLALKIVAYRQESNYAAYRYHGERALKLPERKIGKLE